MKQRLSRIHAPWRRRLLTTTILCLCVVNFFMRSRAQVHWIGPQRNRRRERHLFAMLFACAWIALEPHELILWAAIGGGGISIFLVLYSVYRFIPRKRGPWVESS